MALWASGSRRSGARSLVSRGGWDLWRGLRKGPGTGFWLDMGYLSVWCVTVMCAGLGTTWGPLEEREVRRRRGRSRRPMLNFSETLILAEIGFRFSEHSFQQERVNVFAFFSSPCAFTCF